MMSVWGRRCYNGGLWWVVGPITQVLDIVVVIAVGIVFDFGCRVDKHFSQLGNWGRLQVGLCGSVCMFGAIYAGFEEVA